MKLETLAVHGGYSPDPTTKAVAVPIYQTTSYAFDDTQHGADLFDLKVAGNIYTRIMNPTQAVLEARVAAMEGGIAGLAVASGMSAITYAIQTIAEAGDNIISASTLYGGTYNLFAHTLPQLGIQVRFADYRDPASFAPLIDASLPKEEIDAIHAALSRHAHDYIDYHNLRTRQSGKIRHVDLHVTLHRYSTLESAHALCDRLEAEIESVIAHANVLIHSDPCDAGCACPDQVFTRPISTTPAMTSAAPNS